MLVLIKLKLEGVHLCTCTHAHKLHNCAHSNIIITAAHTHITRYTPLTILPLNHSGVRFLFAPAPEG